jgi:hypothetical protein
MITDTYILEEFEEHELFMDMETCPLRLIQLDLHRFSLGKCFFGLVMRLVAKHNYGYINEPLST